MEKLTLVLVVLLLITFVLISGCIEIESDKTNETNESLKTNKGANESICDNYTGVCIVPSNTDGNRT